MKKIVLLSFVALLLMAATAFVPSTTSDNAPPAATYVVNGGQVTLADTNELEIKFYSSGSGTAFITVVSATTGVQIGSGETIVSQHRVWPADSKVPIGFSSSSTIRVKGGAGDVIALTYTR